MKKTAPSRVVELRIPQHGPVAATAPEDDKLEVMIKSLLDRRVVRLQHPPETPNQTGDSTTTESALDIADELEDIVLRKPDLVQEKDQLLVLQQWEGYVTDIGADSFDANLIDLTAGNIEPSEEAELPVSDLSRDDRRILQKGAVFRWLIGYRISPRGTRQRFSSIFFRRVAAPTDDQISETRKEAKILAASIRWE
jgi:hypothetical protein